MPDRITDAADVLPARPSPKLEEGKRRFQYVQSCFRLCREVEGTHAGFNESLDMLDRGLHKPRRKRRSPKRMHPMIEIAISHLAKGFAGERTGDPNTRPQQAEVDRACEKVLAAMKPVQGRPRDDSLHYHVEGMMCLWQWLTGKEVTATGNAPSADYGPKLTSLGGQLIWKLLHEVDPSVTKTAVVHAIIEARGERRLVGKQFRDWFPLYGATLDPEIGSPQLGMGLRLDSFERSYPIYSS